MQHPEVRLYLFETYYFASIVQDTLHDRWNHLRVLHEFLADDAILGLASGFNRRSALHSFIEFITRNAIQDEMDEVKLDTYQDEFALYCRTRGAASLMGLDLLPIEDSLRRHNVRHKPFTKWLSKKGLTFLEATKDHMSEYNEHLKDAGVIDMLVEQIVLETFFLLFSNRSFLLVFNDWIAEKINAIKLDDINHTDRKMFQKNGVLRRLHIPDWAKRAVYFRDRGQCVLCQTDLSGARRIWNDLNYDHIVPLRVGGLNDVSNLQLLCGTCNRAKSAKRAKTSNVYEGWYPLE